MSSGEGKAQSSSKGLYDFRCHRRPQRNLHHSDGGRGLRVRADARGDHGDPGAAAARCPADSRGWNPAAGGLQGSVMVSPWSAMFCHVLPWSQVLRK